MLLIVAWLHACIGLHTWLRLKPWYAAHERLTFALALLLPALALAGYVSGGMQVVRRAADEGWINIFADAGMNLGMIDWVLHWTNLAAGVCGPADRAVLLRARAAACNRGQLRALSRSHNGRTAARHDCARGAACCTHGARVGVRWPWALLDVPGAHRYRSRAPAGTAGRSEVLRRIGTGVRAARVPVAPSHGCSVTVVASGRDGGGRDGACRVSAQRSAVAVLFADMRGFTRLPNRGCPDVVFVLNRYREEMAHTIEPGGVVNSSSATL